jgi:hypothetical protein
MTATTVTEQVFKLAEQAGLHPTWSDPYRSTRTINLMGEGAQSPFGTIWVGANSGRILRASITYGNGGATRKYTGAVEVRAALKELIS